MLLTTILCWLLGAVLCADRCVKRCDAYNCVRTYIIEILSACAVYIISDAVSGLDVADRCTDSRTGVFLLLLTGVQLFLMFFCIVDSCS